MHSKAVGDRKIATGGNRFQYFEVDVLPN